MGVSFNYITNFWQLVDLNQLKHHLAGSLYLLHAQPPLFNLTIGILQNFSPRVQETILFIIFQLMSFFICWFLFSIASVLIGSNGFALVIVTISCASPSLVLYGNWSFYALPTLFFLMGAIAFYANWLVREKWSSAIASAFFWCLLVMLNTTFQLPLLIVLVSPFFIHYRKDLIKLLSIAIPCLLVVAWITKNLLLFGVPATTSWSGMNLARTTISTLSPNEIAEGQNNGLFNYVASIPPFSPLNAYHLRVRLNEGKKNILNMVTDTDGRPMPAQNLNNLQYIAISNLYLHDDLAAIFNYPKNYFGQLTRNAKLYFAPSEDYVFLQKNQEHLQNYARYYNFVFEGVYSASSATEITGLADHNKAVPISKLSFFAFLEVLVACLTIAHSITFYLLNLLRRKTNFDTRPISTRTMISVVISWVFVVTTLTEYGENQRFRFDYGMLGVVLMLSYMYDYFKKRFSK